jgi:hypothetical protein
MTNDFDKTAQNNSTTGSLKIVILPKDNGLYACQLSSEIEFSKTNLHSDFPKTDILCDGQNPETTNRHPNSHRPNRNELVD